MPVAPETAFRAFTTDFDRWWPRTHHIAAVEMAEAVLEPRPGGRWYERGTDGSECEWGEVLEWDPPRRLVLSWNIDGTYTYRAGLEHASRVTVSFTPLDAGGNPGRAGARRVRAARRRGHPPRRRRQPGRRLGGHAAPLRRDGGGRLTESGTRRYGSGRGLDGLKGRRRPCGSAVALRGR